MKLTLKNKIMNRREKLSFETPNKPTRCAGWAIFSLHLGGGGEGGCELVHIYSNFYFSSRTRAMMDNEKK